MKRTPGSHHLRVAPGVDVAACGARSVPFVGALNLATCPACVEKRKRTPAAQKAFGDRIKKVAKARRAYFLSRPDDLL